jgi:hypothetical protein
MGCGNAVELVPEQVSAYCGARTNVAVPGTCGYIGPVQWPGNASELTMTLAKRPMDRNRNWFPADHPLAVQGNMPHGQSVGELDAETEQHGSL